MTTRVGLGIGRNSVRAVLLRKGKIVWSRETALSDDIDLRAALEQTLHALPRKRGWRRTVVAAIGPSLTQVKSLSLGRASNDRLLGEAVSANVGRFFLRNGVPLRVSGVRRDSPERAWVAAIEEPAAVAVEEACRGARLRYLGAVPSLAVLRHALNGDGEPQTITWLDDDIAGQVTIEGGRLTRATRATPNDDAEAQPAVAGALASLNGDGWRLADAYAGAVADHRDPLVLRPMADAVRRRRRRVVRRIALGTLSAAVALTALLAPGLLAARAQSKADSRLTELAPRQREVAAAQQALSRVTRALQRAADYEKGRPQMTKLLASITEATPQMTAVLNLRIDSVGGSLLALSPHGAEVFAAISHLPMLTGARITSPLTRETIESAELERVSIRFQFVRTHAPSTRRSPQR